MKKKYIKPELLYEQYMLNQHMASCTMELSHDNEYACKAEGQAEFTGMTLFMEQDVCGMEMNTVQTYCYYTATSSIATVGLSSGG